MSNMDNVENWIQIHSYDIHIKNEYKYVFYINVFSGYEYK
jgi:hypothetical protein